MDGFYLIEVYSVEKNYVFQIEVEVYFWMEPLIVKRSNWFLKVILCFSPQQIKDEQVISRVVL